MKIAILMTTVSKMADAVRLARAALDAKAAACVQILPSNIVTGKQIGRAHV